MLRSQAKRVFHRIGLKRLKVTHLKGNLLQAFEFARLKCFRQRIDARLHGFPLQFLLLLFLFNGILDLLDSKKLLFGVLANQNRDVEDFLARFLAKV